MPKCLSTRMSSFAYVKPLMHNWLVSQRLMQCPHRVKSLPHFVPQLSMANEDSETSSLSAQPGSFPSSSNTSLQQPRCFRCNVQFVARYAICDNRDCSRTSESDRVAFCAVCIRQAACGECNRRFTRAESATLRSLSFLSTQSTEFTPDGIQGSDTLEEVEEQAYALCAQCNSEDPQHGREDEEDGRFYCAHCWELWDGRILDEVKRAAENWPMLEVCSFPDIRKLVHLRMPRYLADCADPACPVHVTDEDCLAAALRLSQQFPSAEPVVLCGCSLHSAGGVRGPAAHTLLGELCRNTTFQVAARDKFPIGRDAAVYAPGVLVLRVAGDDAAFSVTILGAVPRDLNDADLLARVSGLLEICRARGHCALVLGAWGCGVRNLEPGRVARAFKQALATAESQVFSQVVFAIKKDADSLAVFRDTFGNRQSRH